jgi:hypothetical protein
MIGSSRPPFCRLGEDTWWRGRGRQREVAHGQGRRQRARSLFYKNDRQIPKDGEIFPSGSEDVSDRIFSWYLVARPGFCY